MSEILESDEFNIKASWGLYSQTVGFRVIEYCNGLPLYFVGVFVKISKGSGGAHNGTDILVIPKLVNII